MRFIWFGIGALVAIVFTRNSAPMETPEKSAVVAIVLIGLAAIYFAGSRDKASAVATAVAHAEARAEAHLNAEIEARATALAQNSLNLYFGQNPAMESRPDSLIRLAKASEDSNSVTRSNSPDSLAPEFANSEPRRIVGIPARGIGE